jgi:DNA-binding SARP family transcriptional activator
VSLTFQQINTLRDKRLRLITLGRLGLEVPQGVSDESLNKRRRKLALLAVLAMSRRPISRDSLVEMFWGDQDEVRARHSLSDALSNIRKVLGRDSLTTHQADVALAEDAQLEIDACDFEEAVGDKNFELGVTLYGGPFLDGVYVAGSASFEQWVQRERTRLEGLFLQACDRQCMALARTRKWDECAALARRWLDAAPLSSSAALFLMNALKAPGTRDADQRALTEYERLAVRLSREFDLAPDKSVAALAKDIAQRLAAANATGELQRVSRPTTSTSATSAPAAPSDLVRFTPGATATPAAPARPGAGELRSASGADRTHEPGSRSGRDRGIQLI